MRDLLPLLRRHPVLYHRAVQQVVPAMSFDYLKINPIGVRAQLPAPSCSACPLTRSLCVSCPARCSGSSTLQLLADRFCAC